MTDTVTQRPTPLVSVRCATYNQASYIRDALDGFVMQQTDFPFEIVVHDDASTDGTADIIREYAERYPDLIVPILETENQWSKRDGSLRRAIQPYLRGKYYALCEGDDYWIDPHKLQRQIEYLEAHPECTMCWTDAYEQYPDGTRRQYARYPQSGLTPLEDVIMQGGMWIPTPSVVVRSEVYKEMPPKGMRFHVGDYPLQVHAADLGSLYYMHEPMAVYRAQSQGSWTSRTFKDVDAIERYYAREYEMLDNLKKCTSAHCHGYLDMLKRVRQLQQAPYMPRKGLRVGFYWRYLRDYCVIPRKYRPKHGLKTLAKIIIKRILCK